MNISIGRIVIYVLDGADAEGINLQRMHGHGKVGNSAHEGDEYPLLVTRVWPNECGEGKPGVNGQVMLDGNDSLWVTSRCEGEGKGKWHWPERGNE